MSDTAEPSAWSDVLRVGMPPCDGETVFVGINSAGFACCFNEVTHDGVCSMQGPEIGTVQMSGLRVWRVLDRPGSAPSLDFMLTDAYAEGRRDEQQELSSVLPGVTYMDPPDGGAPTVLEQLQRQAKDAARYLWLRNTKAYVAVQPHYRDLPKAQRTGWTIRLVCGNDESFDAAIDAAMAADGYASRVLSPAPASEPRKLWLWKNFVDGRPEYWAFDNPYPIHLNDGDPQTLGEPCGYAIVKPSRNGRPDVPEETVLRAIARVWGTPPAPAGGEGRSPVVDAAYEQRMREFMRSRGIPEQTIDRNVEIARAAAASPSDTPRAVPAPDAAPPRHEDLLTGDETARVLRSIGKPAAAPALAPPVQLSDERRLTELIDQYWDMAYAEGRAGREHDTPSGDAQRVRSEIFRAIRALDSARRYVALRTAGAAGPMGDPEIACGMGGRTPPPDFSAAPSHDCGVKGLDDAKG